MQESNNPLIGGPAYAIFVIELARHLEWTRSLELSAAQPSLEIYRELGARFHTIKGGAGFFGLRELGDLAGKIEAACENSLNLDISEIKETLASIDRLAQEIPAPRADLPQD